jgi:hypothetical protein
MDRLALAYQALRPARLIASDAGLAAVTPYISMLIHGYNTRTMHIRRIHLIWQVEELGRFLT